MLTCLQQSFYNNVKTTLVPDDAFTSLMSMPSLYP